MAPNITLTPTDRASSAAAEQSPFARICCVADDSPAGCEAARQGAALVAPGSDLCLISPHDVTADTDRALTAALRVAAGHGATTSWRTAEADEFARLLFVAARERDLLVVPPAGAGGALTHGAWPGPRRLAASVLIARPAPAGRRFPDAILLVSDSSPDSQLPATLSAWIAAEHSARLLRVDPQDRQVHRLLAEQGVELIEPTGVKSVAITAPAALHERAVELMWREHPTLVVLDDRQRGRLGALSHPSDRLAEHAPCSVLIARSGLR